MDHHSKSLNRMDKTYLLLMSPMIHRCDGPKQPRHGERFAARAPPSPVAMNVELILKTGGWHGLTIK